MDYILILLQVISLLLANIYLFNFFMVLGHDKESNGKKYGRKFFVISIAASIIFILNLLLNVDFVSIGERKVVFNMFVISQAVNVIVNKNLFKDAVHIKVENYVKKEKIGSAVLFVVFITFIICTVLKLFNIYI